jgi:hypothetical protein
MSKPQTDAAPWSAIKAAIDAKQFELAATLAQKVSGAGPQPVQIEPVPGTIEARMAEADLFARQPAREVITRRARFPVTDPDTGRDVTSRGEVVLEKQRDTDPRPGKFRIQASLVHDPSEGQAIVVEEKGNYYKPLIEAAQRDGDDARVSSLKKAMWSPNGDETGNGIRHHVWRRFVLPVQRRLHNRWLDEALKEGALVLEGEDDTPTT